MDPVIILDVTDAGELLTLQRAAYLPEAREHEDWELPPLVESLEQLADVLAADDVTALGLRDAGRLVASVRFRVVGDVAELSRLVVAPDRQGAGLGRRLLSEAERRLSAKVSQVRLFTGERSARNLRLYDGFGYRVTGRSPQPAGYALVYLAKAL